MGARPDERELSVTPPDPDSVMGYDDCVGINQNTPRLSAWDRLGAYYAYTWGHRRSLLMGAIDDVDDYAYDGTGRTGVLWQTSRDAQLELWTSTASAGENIDFEKRPLCADGGVSPCMGEFDVQGRVRPVPTLLAGTPGDSTCSRMGLDRYWPTCCFATTAWRWIPGASISMDLQYRSWAVSGSGSTTRSCSIGRGPAETHY